MENESNRGVPFFLLFKDFNLPNQLLCLCFLPTYSFSLLPSKFSQMKSCFVLIKVVTCIAIMKKNLSLHSAGAPEILECI